MCMITPVFDCSASELCCYRMLTNIPQSFLYANRKLSHVHTIVIIVNALQFDVSLNPSKLVSYGHRLYHIRTMYLTLVYCFAVAIVYQVYSTEANFANFARSRAIRESCLHEHRSMDTSTAGLSGRRERPIKVTNGRKFSRNMVTNYFLSSDARKKR